MKFTRRNCLPPLALAFVLAATGSEALAGSSEPPDTTAPSDITATTNDADGLLLVDVGAAPPGADLVERFQVAGGEDARDTLSRLGFGADGDFPVIANAVLNQLQGSASGPMDDGVGLRTLIAVYLLQGTDADVQHVVDTVGAALELGVEDYELQPTDGADGGIVYASLAAIPLDPAATVPAWSIQATYDAAVPDVVTALVEREDRISVDGSSSIPAPITDHEDTLTALSNALGAPTDWSFVRANADRTAVIADTFGFIAAGDPRTVANIACQALGLAAAEIDTASAAYGCAAAADASPHVTIDIRPDPMSEGFARVTAQVAS